MLIQRLKKAFWRICAMFFCVTPHAQAAIHSDFVQSSEGNNFLIGIAILITCMVMGLSLLAFFIMRGFRGVIKLQNQSLSLAARERSLKDKEKYVFATMLVSEIESNLAKIQAYIMIYEEAYNDFLDPKKEPKYKKSGEVVQKQPALNRSVFDGNTDKLDQLGVNLASETIHYYARIKTIPDYEELTSDRPEPEAKELINGFLKRAKKMEEVSNTLMTSFLQHGLIKLADKN